MRHKVRAEHFTLINDLGEVKEVYQLLIDGELAVAIDESDYEEAKEYLEL